jgi:UDP-N-acetylglucosamine enolpyruvyl transferase
MIGRTGWIGLIGLVLLGAAGAGCKATFFEQRLPGGRVIRARDLRLLTTTTAQIEATINPTNGIIVIRVKAASRGDAAFIEAVAAGAAKGAVQGIK